MMLERLILAAALAVALPALALPTVARGENCWNIPSVVDSARFDRNAEFGGHLVLQFRDSTPPFFRPPYDTQEGKSLFDTREQYAAAREAAIAAKPGPECPDGGGHNFTQTVPGSGLAYHCDAAFEGGNCVSVWRFQIKTVKFVFSYVDGRWIVLTAFPQKF